MAKLDSTKFTQNNNPTRNNVHDDTEATYKFFTIGDKKYFQIDTYGSSERKLKGKVSQSIQIDEEMAKVLIEKLELFFNL